MKRRKLNILSLLGIAVGVIGIISPILWERYRSSSALELQYISLETLVEKSDQFEKLTITYNGENLEQISKADFILVNTGRTPIVEKDLVSPPQIAFGQDIEVLDVRIETLQPENSGAKVDFDKARNTVIITFPLLNPNDYIHFSVLTNSKALDFDAKARIARIPHLSVVQKIPRANKVSRSVSWTVYPVGFFSAGLLLAGVSGAKDSVDEHRVKRLVKDGQFAIPRDGTRETYLSFINMKLSFTMSSERQLLIDMVKSFPKNKPLDSTQQLQIEKSIHTIIRSAVQNLPTALFALITGLGGFCYVFAQIR